MEFLNATGSAIVDAAYQVHNRLGPGLLESIYEDCLAYDLESRGLPVQRQVTMPVAYRDIQLEGGYRMDLVVAGAVIVEVKAVETVQPVHRAQLLTYLKLSRHTLGYLINVNVPIIKSGIHRLRQGF